MIAETAPNVRVADVDTGSMFITLATGAVLRLRKTKSTIRLLARIYAMSVI